MDWDTTTWLQLIGLIAAGIPLLVALIKYIKKKYNSTITLFLCNEDGLPQTNLAVVFADGKKFKPSNDGLVLIPSKRSGVNASIRCNLTLREIMPITIPSTYSEAVRIEVTS